MDDSTGELLTCLRKVVRPGVIVEVDFDMMKAVGFQPKDGTERLCVMPSCCQALADVCSG